MLHLWEEQLYTSILMNGIYRTGKPMPLQKIFTWLRHNYLHTIQEVLRISVLIMYILILDNLLGCYTYQIK